MPSRLVDGAQDAVSEAMIEREEGKRGPRRTPLDLDQRHALVRLRARIDLRLEEVCREQPLSRLGP